MSALRRPGIGPFLAVNAGVGLFLRPVALLLVVAVASTVPATRR